MLSKRVVVLMVATVMAALMVFTALPALADAPGKFTCTAMIGGQTYTKKNLTQEEAAQLQQLGAANNVLVTCTQQ